MLGEIFFEAKAVNQGHAEAQCSLGIMLIDGRDVLQDYDKAIEWFTLAFQQGDEKAAKILKEMCL